MKTGLYDEMSLFRFRNINAPPPFLELITDKLQHKAPKFSLVEQQPQLLDLEVSKMIGYYSYNYWIWRFLR